jgi:hypothetical protein
MGGLRGLLSRQTGRQSKGSVQRRAPSADLTPCPWRDLFVRLAMGWSLELD